MPPMGTPRAGEICRVIELSETPGGYCHRVNVVQFVLLHVSHKYLLIRGLAKPTVGSWLDPTAMQGKSPAVELNPLNWPLWEVTVGAAAQLVSEQ